MSHGDWKDMFRGVQDNDLELVQYYLKLGIDINYQHPEYMTSPLIESIRYNNSEMTAFLIENGASVHNKEAFSNKSPIDIAREMGNQEAIELLSQHIVMHCNCNDAEGTFSNGPINSMKAVCCNGYGSTEVLSIRRVGKPIPQSNEILVKIMASAVNSGDVRVRGMAVAGFMAFIMRLVLGFNKPRKPILGTVFSGIVEKTGRKVRHFKAGDEVFGLTGFKFGCHAEYITLTQTSNVILKPKNANFEEAAAILFGGQTAIYFLEKAKIKQLKNPKILIIGATGSVGISAIQIAKQYGGEVTAVCSSDGADLVKSLGVEQIMLYDKENFLKSNSKFDIIFDAVGKYSKRHCFPLLEKPGVFKTVGGLEFASETKEQLMELKNLYESGKLKAVIDKTFSLQEAVAAHNYVDTGRKKGNVILKICE